jgi:hypothetical protein
MFYCFIIRVFVIFRNTSVLRIFVPNTVWGEVRNQLKPLIVLLTNIIRANKRSGKEMLK